MGDEPHFTVSLHDLDMGEPLGIRAYLVLALHDQHASIPQDAVGFGPGFQIQVKHGFVVFAARPIAATVIPVVTLKRSVG